MEEGSSPSRMEPFKTPPPPRAGAAPILVQEDQPVPVMAETWLLAPVAAPDFSLPDLTGQVESLSARRGKPLLLYFWSAESPDCRRDLAEFEQSHARWAGEGLQLITANVDGPPGAGGKDALAPYRDLPFPVLRASTDVVAIYNILFRSLFDRHHDFSLPTSFLIDPSGAIVKIYQGAVPAGHFEEDFRNIPRTAAERLAKALPFPGVIESSEFRRNYLSYGSVFFERGYPEQAEFFFQMALQDDPSSAEALYGLGSVYLEQQKPREARESFERRGSPARRLSRHSATSME